MVDRPGAGAPLEERVSTGCPELDTILHGGLVPHRPYLIVGPAGTGKTTLALQFLCEGVRRGERCLLITLEEPPNEMRINHPGLRPAFDQVYVFDAIPDVMRYERTPFKDIAAVRESIPFEKVPLQIRKTPELSSVEVTFTALEQTIKMEIARRAYSRIVVDSLTALQYFCMKGVDEIVGAQTFLRFLSDLRVTTLLTVESPLEDVETPERLLARGEIRLFRWELDGRTVRALGVEKLRGSSHDVRLHPYRISPQGLDINLEVTISRDTRRVIEEAADRAAPGVATEAPAGAVARDPLEELEAEVADLLALDVPLAEVRVALGETVAALEHDRTDEALRCFRRARQLLLEAAERAGGSPPTGPPEDERSRAVARLASRAMEARTGTVPVEARELAAVSERIKTLVAKLPATPPVPAAVGPIAPPAVLAPPEAPAPPMAPSPSVPTPAASAPVPPPPAAPARVAPPPPPAPKTAPRPAAPPSRPAAPAPARSGAKVATRSPPAAPAPHPAPVAPAPPRVSAPPPPLPVSTASVPAPPPERPAGAVATAAAVPVAAHPAPAAVPTAVASDRPSLPTILIEAPATPVARAAPMGQGTGEPKEPAAKRRKRPVSAARKKPSAAAEPEGPAEAGAETEPRPKRRAPRKKKVAETPPPVAEPALDAASPPPVSTEVETAPPAAAPGGGGSA